MHDHERVADRLAHLRARRAGGAVGRRSPTPAVAGAAAAALLLYAWWAVGLAPFSLGATLAVVLAGAAAVAVGAWTRPRAVAGPRGRVGPWLLLVAALAAVQLAAYVQHPREDHPTLSSLANAVLDSHPARAAAFAAWLVAAVALARR